MTKDIVQITIETCLNSGDFQIKFKNVSHPGVPIDYTKVLESLRKIICEVDKQVVDLGINSSDQCIKEIH